MAAHAIIEARLRRHNAVQPRSSLNDQTPSQSERLYTNEWLENPSRSQRRERPVSKALLT